MKDCCERDESTSAVTVGTGSQRKLVEKFRGKFIREARIIHGMSHPNIVKVTDVFEENGTAYYVMENLTGGSLVKRINEDGPFSEAKAEKYIRQVAEALKYIHSQHTVHLDVKPSNILLNAKGDAVLIDFGISKHYDDAGEQTSSTPVGISKGYAPLEQSRDGDVSQFKPSTDIYALGATLFHLVTGQVPPEASIVNEDGLERPNGISDRIWNAIEQAMQPRRKDRPQSVSAFMSLLDGATGGTPEEEDETTVPEPKKKSGSDVNPSVNKEPEVGGGSQPSGKKKPKPWLWALIGGVVAAAVIVALILGGKEKPDGGEVVNPVDTAAVAAIDTQTTAAVPDSKSAPEPASPGSIKISTTPAGATIWIDGKNTKKTTPEILEDIAPGKHSVKFVLEGYEDASGSVTVTSGQRTNLSKTLTAKPAENPTPAQPSSPSQVQQETPSKPEVKEEPMTGTLRGHDWVDLGLSVKWATCNVGASSPSDYGKYYAWGETTTKSEYTWVNYRFRVTGDSYNDVTFSKYNTNNARGTVDNKTCLEMTDDAARANWGVSWRMPTDAEWTELREKCTWTWTTQGGKSGYEVTSKTNGNSIFLPAAGCRSGVSLLDAGSDGDYWSSSLDTSNPCNAWYVYFDSSDVYRSNSNRCYGFSVRPVTE